MKFLVFLLMAKEKGAAVFAVPLRCAGFYCAFCIVVRVEG